MRWYLRYGLSYRDVEELLAERGIEVDHVTTYSRVLDELVTAPRHVTEQYANNWVEADHGRLKARLRPMRGLKQIASPRTVAAGHAFVQNLRRGHYELTADPAVPDRVRVAFDQFTLCV